MKTPEVRLVIAAKNEGDNLVDMVESSLGTGSGLGFEIVVVDDGSTDGCGDRVRQRFGHHPAVSLLRTGGVGVAAARNTGARDARAPLLVFLDGHCWCPPGWLELLLAPLVDGSAGLTGPAFTDLLRDDAGIGCGVEWPAPDLQMAWLACEGRDPYAVPLMPGGCDALRRETFAAVGGYDEGMGRWGSEGEELSLRVWTSGLEVQVVPRCLVRHFFRERHPYPVDVAEVLHNRLRMATVHFPEAHLTRVIERSRTQPGFARAMSLLLLSDAVWRRSRREPHQTRHTADWFRRFVTRWD